jgi:hypothetical protein
MARFKTAVLCLTRGEGWRSAFTEAARWNGVLEWYAEKEKDNAFAATPKQPR